MQSEGIKMQKSLLFVLLLIVCVAAHANPKVESREYKLMLKVDLFQHETEAQNVGSFLDKAKSTIEAATNRNVTGSERLKKIRDVRFYDIQGTCQLNEHGYIFRERIEIENGDSEVTLKFRSPDRYISSFEDLSASSSPEDRKLEADIGISSTSPFKIVYGHSNTVPNKRTINKMGDINHHFTGFKNNYHFSNDTELSPVGGLIIREHVYKGREIDLEQAKGKISVTLWYHGIPSDLQKPVIAEVSFKYEDESANYTKEIVNLAKAAFDALQSLTDWIDPNSKTKTQWVYDFDSGFCN